MGHKKRDPSSMAQPTYVDNSNDILTDDKVNVVVGIEGALQPQQKNRVSTAQQIQMIKNKVVESLHSLSIGNGSISLKNESQSNNKERSLLLEDEDMIDDEVL